MSNMRRAAMAATALLLAAAAQGAAQEAKPQAMADPAAAGAPGWAPECGPLVCAVAIAMHQGADGVKSGALRFEWARYGAKAGLISATVSAPLGIATQPGVRLLIDDRAIEMPVKVCFPDGCAAAAELDAAQSDALRAVRRLEIRFIVFADGRTLSLTPDTAGLNEALAGG